MKSKKLPVLIGVAALMIVIVIAIILTVLFISNKGHRVIKVESFSGEVALERGESEKEIFEDMNLKTEDVITTGADGLIGLLADDDKNIAAFENTCFAIVSEGNDQNGALKIELKYGTSLIEIENRLPDGSSFEVETSNATLSVRGTSFEVTYIPDSNTTLLKVHKGMVQVDTSANTGMVNAGQMAIITDDRIEIADLTEDVTTVPGGNEASDDAANGSSQPVSGSLIGMEEWADLLKGGSDYEELTYLLEVASRCEYEGENDYLQSGLYWMCVEYGQPPFEPVEKLENGGVAYDVAALNEKFSFITKDTISEDNLNSGFNLLEGNRLICTTVTAEFERVASAAIYEAWYGESGEIIVDYQFNVVHYSTMEVEQFRKLAYLTADETGKYVLDHIESK